MRTHLKRKEVDDVLGGKDAWANVDSTECMSSLLRCHTLSPSSLFPPSPSVAEGGIGDLYTKTTRGDSYWVYGIQLMNRSHLPIMR